MPGQAYLRGRVDPVHRPAGRILLGARGPRIDEIDSGESISLPRINLTSPRWHGFARSARTAGYCCADATAWHEVWLGTRTVQALASVRVFVPLAFAFHRG